MTVARILSIGLVGCLGIYLFVSAPPELGETQTISDESRVVDTEKMFMAANKINEAARGIYTARIVGPGAKAGLKFGEDWSEPNVDKGPLPALFLRMAAQRMETKPPRLGLYLGSDEPINNSNLFLGEQALSFAALKEKKAAVFADVERIGKVAMFPDIASADACVTCHNEHADSPKTDWKLNDVMGATTWTYPTSKVAPNEYLAATEALYQSVEEAYASYISKARGFDQKIVIGDQWPDANHPVLPDTQTFMAAVRAQSAEDVLMELVLITDDKLQMMQELSQ